MRLYCYSDRQNKIFIYLCTTRRILQVFILIFVPVSLLAQSNNLDSLSKIWKNAALSDSLRLEALRNVAFQYIWVNADTAIQLSRVLYRMGDSLNDQKSQVSALLRMGSAYEVKGNIDSAEVYLNRSIAKEK